MSWREQLRAASFRGVPFLVDGHEADAGRRVQVHEFPLRDKPYAEDLGRKARFINVDAFVLGADYMAGRDKLLNAIELAGSGSLVHPYLGTLTVTVLDCRMRESTAEGGLARFALTMVESGENLFPVASVATGTAVKAARDYATEAAQANFARRHALAKRPQFVATASTGLLGKALDTVQAAANQVRSVVAKVAALTRAVTVLKQQAISIIYAPAQVAQELVATVKLLVREVAYGPREALDLARTLFRFGSDLPNVPTNTGSRRQQGVNQAAMVQLVRLVAVAEAAGAVADLAFDSYQDALAVRAELAGVMDELLESADLDDTQYDALRELRAATVRDITERGADLARVVSYAPRQTLPALVVAQQVYADATRADEIVLRNRIAHPGFLPGDRALEVLTNG